MLKQSWLRPATMPMDAYRQDEHLVINFDVPGVHADAIDVTVENNTLKVVAARPRPTAEGIQWLASERAHGTSTCELYLGHNLDVSALVAKCDDGVLTITIPLIEGASRRIEITSGDHAAESTEAPVAA
jgi:HSP20 family protein